MRQTIHMWPEFKFRELGPPFQMSFVAALLRLSVWLAGCMPVPNWLLSSLTPHIHLCSQLSDWDLALPGLGGLWRRM